MYSVTTQQDVFKASFILNEKALLDGATLQATWRQPTAVHATGPRW